MPLPEQLTTKVAAQRSELIIAPVKFTEAGEQLEPLLSEHLHNRLQGVLKIVTHNEVCVTLVNERCHINLRSKNYANKSRGF